MKIEHLNNTFNICYLIFDIPLYTLPQYSISIQKQMNKYQITNVKFQKIQPYIKLLSKIPLVIMIGITGSASMGNCKKNDDIDLCVITKSKSLWITRFICVVIAKMMNLYGKYICLNLFFDESDLTIPQQKQTIYIGHELLQMKPVVNKNNTYEQMLSKNKWIYSLFPNAYLKSQMLNVKCQMSYVTHFTLHVTQLIDNIFKILQLSIIRKNKTFLLITDTQLWLFKMDFEARLPHKIR